MTETEAKTLQHSQIIYHRRERDSKGFPLRARCNGRLQKHAGSWRVPLKHGLSTHFYLTPSNFADWELTEEEAAK